MVFLWAYQRRRYSDQAARQLASRLLDHPIAFYVGFTAIVLLITFYAAYSYRFEVFASLPRVIFNETVGEWLL